jgi:hypothetical protein
MHPELLIPILQLRRRLAVRIVVLNFNCSFAVTGCASAPVGANSPARKTDSRCDITYFLAATR